MSKPGPQPKVNPETAFEYWYNDGERRTFVETAARFDVHQDTVRRYADDNDWDGRADELDQEIRRQRDKRLASLLGKMRAREIEAIATLESRFFRRLIPVGEDGKPNPAAIRPEDIGIREFEILAKLLEMKVGGVPVAGAEERQETLDDIERQIMELDLKEQAKGVDGEHDPK